MSLERSPTEGERERKGRSTGKETLSVKSKERPRERTQSGRGVALDRSTAGERGEGKSWTPTILLKLFLLSFLRGRSHKEKKKKKEIPRGTKKKLYRITFELHLHRNTNLVSGQLFTD